MKQKELRFGIIFRQIIHNAAPRDLFLGSKKSIFYGWIGKGFWALTDQALFSGSNFLVNILLARWLSPEEYGAFAVAVEWPR